MPPSSTKTLSLNKRALTTLLSALALLLILYISLHHTTPAPTVALTTPPDPSTPIDPSLLRGDVISAPITNATLKAELGRASWKLFHTMMAKFPEKPSAEDQSALSSYIYLFARLYPCGDCAKHFQGVLERFPPQVGGRNAAAGWGCHVHNVVNKRLGKEEFDCNEVKEVKRTEGRIDLVVERNGLTAGG